jgi:hypothetical protein
MTTVTEPPTVAPESPDRQSAEGLWDVSDVMSYLNVKSQKTIRRRIRDGLPSKKIGGLLRFDPEAVRRWVAEQGDAAA